MGAVYGVVGAVVCCVFVMRCVRVVSVLVCVVLCGVVVCGLVFVVVWHADNLRVCIQHGPVCAFKTFPCVPETCAHV